MLELHVEAGANVHLGIRSKDTLLGLGVCAVAAEAVLVALVGENVLQVGLDTTSPPLVPRGSVAPKHQVAHA